MNAGRSRSRTRRAVLDLRAEDSRLNVYAGELEVRPPGAPTTEGGSAPQRLDEAAESLDHIWDVRFCGGIREEDLFQRRRGRAGAHRHREQIDHVVGVGAEHMGAEDASRRLLDQHLEAGMRLADPPRGVPRSGVALVDIERHAPTLRVALEETDGCQRWDGEHDARNHRVVWSLPLLFIEQVGCNDPSLIS